MPQTAPSLGADVEMLNNQLTVSSNNHPPLTVVTAATAAASGDMGVAFATAVEGIVDVDVIAQPTMPLYFLRLHPNFLFKKFQLLLWNSSK